jgi:hypothetical protein
LADLSLLAAIDFAAWLLVCIVCKSITSACPAPAYALGWGSEVSLPGQPRPPSCLPPLQTEKGTFVARAIDHSVMAITAAGAVVWQAVLTLGPLAKPKGRLVVMALTTFARFATARASSSSTRPRGRLADVAWPAMTRVNVTAVLATALYLLFGSSAIAGWTPSVCQLYGGTVFNMSLAGYKYSNSLQQKDISAELKVLGFTSDMVRKLTPAVKSAVRSPPFRTATRVGMAIGGNLFLFGGWLEEKDYCLLPKAAPTKMEE